jgi:hypothetical protein
MADLSTADLPAKRRDPEIDYRSVEPWALFGLIAGLLAPLGLLSSVLWLLPWAGIAVNVLALRRLKLDANRVGRRAALLGLGLSLIFAVLPVVQTAADRVLLPPQGRVVADQFFEFLRQDSPEKALNLKFAPDYQQPLDDELWNFYRYDNEAKEQLNALVRFPLARTLLALGPRAEVRYFRTVGVSAEGNRALVIYWYTVSYADRDGKKKTFVVSVLMERLPTRKPGINPWRVKDFAAIDPDRG